MSTDGPRGKFAENSKIELALYKSYLAEIKKKTEEIMEPLIKKLFTEWVEMCDEEERKEQEMDTQ